MDFTDEYDTVATSNDIVTPSNYNVVPSNEESDIQTNLNLPSNPQRGQLQEIPRGWLRKVVTTGKARGQQKVFYYNTMGKKFSSKEDVEQYFGRLGQTVKPGLFNFDPPAAVAFENEKSFGNGEGIQNGRPSSTSSSVASLVSQH